AGEHHHKLGTSWWRRRASAFRWCRPLAGKVRGERDAHQDQDAHEDVRGAGGPGGITTMRAICHSLPSKACTTLARKWSVLVGPTVMWTNHDQDAARLPR